MGYEIKRFENVQNCKIVPFLVANLNLTERKVKRLIDKGRVKENGEIVAKKGQIVSGAIEALVFKPTLEDELLPVFDSEHFAVFNKPSGMLSHPNGFNDTPSVLDYAKHYFGNNANITHRLDALTSGLIVVAKNRAAECEFKRMFEAREVQKEYIALLRGKLEKATLVDAPLKQEPFGEVRQKMQVRSDGKECITEFIPLEINQNSTLVRVVPKTGRLHQIRAHSEYIGHAIIGDPLYGVNSDVAKAYLERTINADELKAHTLGDRLCLHASVLEFCFFGESFKIESSVAFN